MQKQLVKLNHTLKKQAKVAVKKYMKKPTLKSLPNTRIDSHSPMR